MYALYMSVRCLPEIFLNRVLYLFLVSPWNGSKNLDSVGGGYFNACGNFNTDNKTFNLTNL
jgi:hypothetical protein